MPHLRKAGIEVDIAPFFSDGYLERRFRQERPRFLDITKSYVARLHALASRTRYDLVWAEKELLPWLPSPIDRIFLHGGPSLVLDYDDAIFHRYDNHSSSLVRALLGRKISELIRHSCLAIVGNSYLRDYAKMSGARRIEMVPTVIDLERYQPVSKIRSEPFTVGWIGTSVTAPYLQLIEPSLRALRKHLEFRFVVIGLTGLASKDYQLECRPWTEESETSELRQIDVGVMPLFDTPWEMGKCGYKLIQYMATGLPVVASPVGANNEIVRNGVSGFLARSSEEWTSALLSLARDRDLCIQMGKAGRRVVEDEFCLQKTAPELVRMLIEAG